MTFKMSSGLINSLMGAQDSIVGITLEITGATTITDSGNGFLTAGFRPGDTVIFTGWPTAGNNSVIATVVSVTAGLLTVSGTALPGAEVGDADSTITSVSKTFKDIFRNNIIRVYSGTIPADADATEGAGVLLLKITLASGAVVPGVATNGNDFDAIVAGVLSKDANVWSGVGLADGTAAWWRMYDNGEITGAEPTSKRCQGSVGTGSVSFILSSTSIVTGATTTLDTANFTMPAS